MQSEYALPTLLVEEITTLDYGYVRYKKKTHTQPARGEHVVFNTKEKIIPRGPMATWPLYSMVSTYVPTYIKTRSFADEKLKTHMTSEMNSNVFPTK